MNINRPGNFLFTLCLLISVTVQAQSTEDAIRNLHEAYCNAVEKKDTVFLKNLFHDKMTITGGDGTRRDKKGEIKDATDPKYLVNFFKARNVDVRSFESTAVVIGEFFWEMVADGKTYKNERTFTFTYAKIGKDWKIVAQHMGRVPPK